MGEVKHSICRVCHAQCPILVEMEDGKPVKVVGDKDNPIYHGYTCVKGRELPYMHYSDKRLLHSQKMQADGTHAPIPHEQAFDEVAEKLKHILDTYGPRSIAYYVGTHGYNNFATNRFADAWMDAIESPMRFSSVTIDQPGKAIATALHGAWQGGTTNIEQADAWMFVGTNPIVSMFGGTPVNPARAIQKAKKRGLELVVVDPRVTDVAKHATIHLQPKPGNDPAILAGMLRVIFEEGLYDQKFTTENVNGFVELREAVDAFTPDFVAERADIPAEKLKEAARMIARAARAGCTAGTGPNMAGYGNLTEYLLLSMMSICGHWLQEGDKLPNPGVLVNRGPAKAQPSGPFPAWGFGEKLRVRNLANTAAGLPTAAAADEILMDGEGKVRALLSLGGNPMMAWPDQLKTYDAIRELDLFISIDPLMTASARLSHYVIAPKLSLEYEATTALQEMLGIGLSGEGYQAPYAQHCEKIMDPPEGSDVIEDWEFFYGISQRMGLELTLEPWSFMDPAGKAANATKLDMSNKPSATQIWEALLKNSPVPLSEVKKSESGKIYDVPEVRVAPRDEGHTARFDVGNDVMMKELEEVKAGIVQDREKDYDFRMISRRLHDHHNSNWHFAPRMSRQYKYNPAFMNPGDMKAHGLKTGDIIEVIAERASIKGIVEEAPDVREGSIAMTHCWGDLPGQDDDVLTHGSNTGRLSSVEKDYDPYSGIPRMSSIPINIRLLQSAVAAE